MQTLIGYVVMEGSEMLANDTDHIGFHWTKFAPDVCATHLDAARSMTQYGDELCQRIQWEQEAEQPAMPAGYSLSGTHGLGGADNIAAARADLARLNRATIRPIYVGVSS